MRREVHRSVNLAVAEDLDTLGAANGTSVFEYCRRHRLGGVNFALANEAFNT